MDSNLANAATDGTVVTKISFFKAVDSFEDDRPPGDVLEALNPCSEYVFVADDVMENLAFMRLHGWSALSVSYRIHFVKNISLVVNGFNRRPANFP